MAESNLRHGDDGHSSLVSALDNQYNDDHQDGDGNVSTTLGETITFQNELANQAHAALQTAVQHQQQQHQQGVSPAPQQSPSLSKAGKQPIATQAPAPVPGPYRQAPNSHISNKAQLDLLRASYARNPFPTKADLKELERETGRPWMKIREYFRQRRNKMRGLAELEGMEEPGRAMSWLQVSYRPAPPTSTVSQLDLYQSYKSRFDPYHKTAPLLGGQELIQLACATFTGCSMARDNDDYVMKGIRDRMKDGDEPQEAQQVREQEREQSLEDYVGSLAEPLRASAWLLSNYQTPLNPDGSSIPQAELYANYAQRFSSLLPIDTDPTPQPLVEPTSLDMPEQSTSTSAADKSQTQAQAQADAEELRQYEHDMNQTSDSDGDSQRLLTPVELLTLAKMTFSKAELVVSDDGRFLVRGLERRERDSDDRSRANANKSGDMFPFAPSEPSPSSPNHPLSSLLKRKLAMLDEHAPRREEGWDEPLTDADIELVEGVKRFKGSRLGREVKDACVSQ